MTTIHAQAIGDQIILSKDNWERLLTVAQRAEPVSVEHSEAELFQLCKRPAYYRSAAHSISGLMKAKTFARWKTENRSE